MDEFPNQLQQPPPSLNEGMYMIENNYPKGNTKYGIKSAVRRELNSLGRTNTTFNVKLGDTIQNYVSSSSSLNTYNMAKFSQRSKFYVGDYLLNKKSGSNLTFDQPRFNHS